MRKGKEKILINHKTSETEMDCLCLKILKLREEKFKNLYTEWKKRLDHQKKQSRPIESILNQVMKTGNKLRALKEAVQEIESAHKACNQMIEINSNGQKFFRLSENLDFKRSCKGKMQYSEESAIQAAREVSEKLNEILEHYKCRYCEHHHIGHSIL